MRDDGQLRIKAARICFDAFAKADLIRKVLSVFPDIIRRIHVKEFMKLRSEIFTINNPNHKHGFRYRIICIDKYFGRLPKPDKANKTVGGSAGYGFNFNKQVGPGHANLIRKYLNIKIWIGNVQFYNLDTLLEKIPVLC